MRQTRRDPAPAPRPLSRRRGALSLLLTAGLLGCAQEQAREPTGPTPPVTPPTAVCGVQASGQTTPQTIMQGTGEKHRAGRAPTLTFASLVLAQAGGDVTTAPGELVYSGPRGSASAPQTVTVRNDGTGPLRVTGLRLTGTHAAAFTLSGVPALPLTLPAGGSLAVAVRFVPGEATGALGAAVRVESDDPDEPARGVNVYGLSARGLQGEDEPTLQAIADTLGYRVDVGGTGLILGTGAEPVGDEVLAPLFRRAGPGPVTLRPVARYSPDDLLAFGYFTEEGGGPVTREVGVVALGQEQTLNPATVAGGGGTFEPGDVPFGLYVGGTSYAPQPSYTRDALNTGPTRHAARVYPLRDRAGQPVANSFLVAFEPAANGDYQDYVFVVGNVTPADAAPDTALAWTERAPALAPVSEAQGAVVGGRLYIFGGFDKDLRTTTRTQVYDPAANRWAAGTAMPEPVTHGAVAVDGTTVYVAGGFVGPHPGPQTAHVWKYDATLGAWSAGPPLPRAVGAGALVRLGRELHFFGGTERDLGNTNIYLRDSADHWVLNLDGGTTWRNAAPLPNPRNHLAGVELGGRLYAVGGQHLGDEEAGNQTAVHMYDPAADAWAACADLPQPLGHVNASTLAWEGRLVVVSGVTQRSAEVAAVYEYDPVANRWGDLTPLPAPRQSPVAGVVGGQLIVATGSLPSGAFATTWAGQR